ncbi:MAG: tetratricopeptide repeat protein [Catenulispora sp.]|nr:tetratricopeptide repeat protein [Catenulispora sp.]
MTMVPGAGPQPLGSPDSRDRPDLPRAADTSDTLVEAAEQAGSLEDLAGLLRAMRRRHTRQSRDSTLTYREMAQRTGWSRSAIAEYFTARTLPPADRFDALLTVLGAAPVELRALADARDRVEEVRRRVVPQNQDTPSRAPARPAAPVTRASPQSGTAPRRLPPDTGLFTGRQEELARLLELAERTLAADSPGTAGAPGFANSPGAAAISVINGMGGVGKTALAVHVAHWLAASFPDGQLFVDLCGFSQERPPREVHDVLAELLRALGVPPGQIPDQAEARAALYRERLAGTRTLVVLDDAGDEAHVLPLLPADAGCLVLVTSRRRLTALDDAEPVPLDVLPRDEAVALLHRCARARPDTTADARWGQVAELCGRLPLALVIAGALLRTGGRAWDLGRLLDRLSPERAERALAGYTDHTRSLSTVFDLSYQSLSSDEQLLFRRLGLLPGTEVDAYAAAALLDADVESADRLIECLADHSLLTGSSPGRYRRHDLLSAYARALGRTSDAEPDRERARDRLLDYYIHVAERSSVLITRRPRPALPGPTPAYAPDLRDDEAARRWLSAEHANLEAAFADADARAADHYAVALAAGLAEFLFAEGPWSRALTIHRAAAAAATRLANPAVGPAGPTAHPAFDPTAHGVALTNLVRAQYLTGDYAAAGGTLAEALSVFRQGGDRLGEAAALTELGRVRYGIGDYAGAAASQQTALELFRQVGNQLGEANALNDLGHVRHLTGDFRAAEEAHKRALEIYRQIPSRLGEAAALTDLGHARYARGDALGATEALEQALEIYRHTGNRLGEANVVHYLGQVRSLIGDHRRAAQAQEQALDAFRQIGSRLGEAAALTELGRVRSTTGDHAGAMDAQEQALEIYREIGSRANEAWALNHYAATTAATGDRPLALALYQQALAMNRALNQPDDEAASLEGIAEHHLSAHNRAEGTAHLHLALEIYQRLGMQADAGRIQARLASIDQGERCLLRLDD